MLIKYNKVNCTHFPKVFPKGVEAHQTTAPEFITFIPGVNSISEDDWNRVKDHPMCKMMLEEDELEIMDAKGETTDDDQNKGGGDLSNYNAKEAQKVVKATANIDLLESWLPLEQRKSVKDSIVAQLKRIEDETAPTE